MAEGHSPWSREARREERRAYEERLRRKREASGRTLLHDVWDGLVAYGLGILGLALILFGAACVSNTLEGNGLVDSDAGSYAICAAVIAAGVALAVLAFRRWLRATG